MHRDISPGNILIDIECEDPLAAPSGFLNDWDLCRYKQDLKMEATQHGRSVSAVEMLFPIMMAQLMSTLR